MAKVHWHKFGFVRNIMPKRRNRRNCKSGSLSVRLLAVRGQGAALLVLACIDNPKLDSTASILLPRLTACLAVSSVIPDTLRRRLWVVWFYGFSAHASFTSTVGRHFVSVSVSATVTAVSEPSVSAVVSVTAITGLQLRRHFRLWPKPEKLVSVSL